MHNCSNWWLYYGLLESICVINVDVNGQMVRFGSFLWITFAALCLSYNDVVVQAIAMMESKSFYSTQRFKTIRKSQALKVLFTSWCSDAWFRAKSRACVRARLSPVYHAISPSTTRGQRWLVGHRIQRNHSSSIKSHSNALRVPSRSFGGCQFWYFQQIDART